MNKNYICSYCNKIFKNGHALGGHRKRCNNPNYVSPQSFLGKHLSDSHKENISKSMKKFFIKNPDKVPYLLNHSMKESYPEKLLKKALINNKIYGWVQQFRNGIYSYDFAFPELKIDVEVDGSTHNLEKVKKIDEERDNFSMENGWTVIRFSDYQIKNCIDSCIDKIIYNIKLKDENFIKKISDEDYDKILEKFKNYNVKKKEIKKLLLTINKIIYKKSIELFLLQIIRENDIDINKSGWVQKICNITGFRTQHFRRNINKITDIFNDAHIRKYTKNKL